jgi:hypothetical protein
VTGDVVDFGGRKPSKAEDEKALADAKACFAAHDPFLPALDFLDRITGRIETAVQAINAGSASALNDEQVKALVYNTERAAERGVSMYATRVRSWHQAIVGGAFVAGLTLGILGTFYIASRQHAAEIEAMRLAVPGVLSAIPAADLAEWTSLIRLNDLSRAQRACIPQAGGTACSIALWTKAPTAGKN